MAKRAGVDAMVISRLEQGQKPRLEVESAARLAQACGWALDQLCGLAATPDLRDAPWEPWYCPRSEEKPAWLQAGLSTTTQERRLAALILSWQARGARLPHIAETLQAWGLQPMEGGGWTATTLRAIVTQWTHGTKKGHKALLTAYQRDHETWS
jgi:hypothetical protein